MDDVRLHDLVGELERTQVWLGKAAQPKRAEAVGRALQVLRQVPALYAQAADRETAVRAKDQAIARCRELEDRMAEMEGHPDVKAMKILRLQKAREALDRQIRNLETGS